MSMNMQIDLSKVCGRKISDEEASRIREVASNMELRDDDAIWQLLAAIEYQKIYYERLPEKISAASQTVIKNIQEAAKIEAEKAQNELISSVVKEAKYLAKKIQWSTFAPLLIIGTIGLFAYSALCMWAGFQLGARAVKPIHDIFLIPWTPIVFLSISIGGLFYSGIAIMNVFNEEKYAKWHFLLAILMFIGGFVILFYIDVALYDRIFK